MSTKEIRDAFNMTNLIDCSQTDGNLPVWYLLGNEGSKFEPIIQASPVIFHLTHLLDGRYKGAYIL